MKASAQWVASSGGDFRADGTVGCAHLTHYTVNYCEWGSGPPLVIVPGMAGGYDLLGPLARKLSRHFRVISYQLRGEDDCFVLRQSFSMSDLVTDLGEFINWLCLETPNVLGVSFGGLVALEYAARFPHRLGRLIVQGVGARHESGLLHQVARTVLSRFPLPADNAFVNQFFNLLFGSGRRNQAVFDFVTRQIWQTDQSVMAHRFKLVEEYSVDRRMHRIRVPALILAGERDVLVSPRSLQDLVDGIRGAQLQRLPNCGHLAFISDPGLVAGKVVDFMTVQA